VAVSAAYNCTISVPRRLPVFLIVSDARSSPLTSTLSLASFNGLYSNVV
jgi:hypothetical protein